MGNKDKAGEWIRRRAIEEAKKKGRSTEEGDRIGGQLAREAERRHKENQK